MPKKPNTKEEKKLRIRGYEMIAGVDEVGRGAWAGPLVAGAVILPAGFPAKQIRDSKLLTQAMRQKMFVYITDHAVSWATAVASNTDIDKLGVGVVNRRMLEQAVKNLDVRAEAVLVDAFPIQTGKKPVKAIIHGDAKVLSIAAASIVAKVIRDEMMRDFAKQYPDYAFDRHKGYGTKQHHALLKKHGPSPIHRMTWAPMKYPSLSPRRQRPPKQQGVGSSQPLKSQKRVAKKAK